MKKYRYKAYSVVGYPWETEDFEIVAKNKQEAYEKALLLSRDPDWQEENFPFICVLVSSFRFIEVVF